MKTCVVLLAEGFEETEAVVPADILRRAGVQVRLVAVECTGSGTTAPCVKGSHGIKIEADTTSAELIAEIENGNIPDAVFCPGGMPGSTNLVKSADTVSVLHAVKQNGGILAAICAAPAVVFAPLGLLDGKSFTGYPGTEDVTKTAPQAKPGTYLVRETVLDGKVLTSRGPGTAAALGFELAALLTDSKTASDVKRGMLF
ncbi:DJ-1/PfpI family protein [Treponema sp. OMZ 840]|uniref:DJ-1 family glyoxalase III n=1 Tax=Treponema sp. OMZ 840 TaxID=244313 RepID=UPI003D8C1DBE